MKVRVKNILAVLTVSSICLTTIGCSPTEQEQLTKESVELAKDSAEQIVEDIVSRENIEKSYEFFKKQYELIQSTKSQIDTLEQTRKDLVENKDNISQNYIKIKLAKLDEQVLDTKLLLDRYIKEYNEKAKDERYGLYTKSLPTSIDEATALAVVLTESQYQEQLQEELENNQIDYTNKN